MNLALFIVSTIAIVLLALLAYRQVRSMISECERSAKFWEDEAGRFCRNETFYRGLLEKIGNLFGKEARTSDDGSVQQDVICLKLPELVEKRLHFSLVPSLPKSAEWMPGDVAALQAFFKTETGVKLVEICRTKVLNEAMVACEGHDTHRASMAAGGNELLREMFNMASQQRLNEISRASGVQDAKPNAAVSGTQVAPDPAERSVA